MRIRAGNQLSQDAKTLGFGPSASLVETDGDVELSLGGSIASIVAALPTGVAATDTANLQAVVTAINAAGGNVDVLLPTGTYVINAALGTITVSNVRFFGKGRGVTKIDFSAASSSTTCLAFAGSVGTHKVLTADTTVGGTTLTCAAGDEAGLVADDWVLVGSEGYYEQRSSLFGANTGAKRGEIAAVASTASGSVTLREALAGGYTDEAAAAQQNYTTADTGFFAKVSFLTGITVEGISFVGTTGSGSGVSQNALTFSLCRHLRVRDVHCDHVAYCAYLIEDCVDFQITGWSAFDCWNTGTGYGVAISNCCQDGVVEFGTGRRMRHVVTGANGSASSGYGVSRRITVAYVKAYDTTADGFKTHAGCGSWTYFGCYSYGAVGCGILAESNDVTIVGCEANRTSYGVQLDNETLNPTRFQVNGFVSKNAVNDGLRYTNPSTTGAEPQMDYTQINNVVAINAGAIGLYCKGVTGHHLKAVSVNDVTAINCANTNGNVYLDFCDAPHVGNIKIRRAPASTSAIRINNCANASVAGWNVEFVSVGSGIGVYVNATADCTVTGGMCSTAGKGVQLDNTSTYCVVTGNDLRGCTSAITEGSGTGHKIAHNIGDVKGQTSVTITTSPQTILNSGPRDVLIAISGGTVSLIEVSNDQSSFSTTGTTTGQAVYVPVGGAARVTYSVSPTLRQIPVL